jgi:hypothetical protein
VAFAYQRQIGTISVLDSTSVQNVAVGAAGVPVGALVVLVMTKSLAFAPSVTDSKGNTYVVREQRNEPIDAQEVAIVECVIATALVDGDTISPTFEGTFSWKTAQVHEFRADGAISFVSAAGASSSFPHDTQSAGTLADTTSRLVVAGWVQNTTSAVTWTPGTGFTALASLDPGDSVGFAQYDLDGAGASHTVLADSSVDAASAGVSACWSEPAAGVPVPLTYTKARMRARGY